MSPDERCAGESSPWEPPDRHDEPPGEGSGEQTVEAAEPPPEEPLFPAPTTPVRRVHTRTPGAAREVIGPGGNPARWAGPVRRRRAPAGRRGADIAARTAWAPRGSFRVADEDARTQRQMSRWMGVGGLALVTALLILAWSAVQLTDRSQATQVLQQALAPLSDIDRLLERDYATLQTQAQAAGGASVIVQSYPLGIAIPAAELSEMSREEVRARVLSVSAERIYESGMGTFTREDAGQGSFFSPSGVFELTAGQLTARNHTIAIIIAVLLALFFVPMLVRALSEGSGAERARNLGAGLALGGLGLAIALLVVRALLRGLLASDDAFSEALLDIGVNAAGLPLRNGLIFGALGGVVLAASLAFEALLWRWAGRRAWLEDAR